MNTKLLGCLVVAAACLQGLARDWYVAENGRDADAGTSAEPFATISNAIAHASNGDVVHVAEGTYPMTYEIMLDKGVTVEGENDKVFLRKTTDVNSKIVRPATLNHADAVLRRVIIDGSGTTTWGPARGGGILLQKGTVDQCVVQNCFSSNTQSGGGICMEGDGGLVTRTVVRRCQSVGNGSYGAGIYMTAGRIDNCLVYGNGYGSNGKPNGWGAHGGGVCVNGANCVVSSCTIANNASRGGGGGLFRFSGKGHVYNTLVYGNEVSESGEADIGYELGSGETVEDVFRNCGSSKTVGANAQMIDEAPFDENYQLVAGKAGVLIDHGDNQYVANEFDCFGGMRIYNGGTVDIGAHELQEAVVVLAVSASALKGVESLTATLKAELTGADAADYDFAWYFDGAETVDATGAQTDKTFGLGEHGVRLVAINKLKPEDRIEVVQPSGWITVYPKVITVGETAGCPDIDSALAIAKQDGMVVRIPEGTHAFATQVKLEAGVTLAGIGCMTNVILKRVNNAFGGSTVFMTHPDAVISNLTIEGNLEWAGTGGGINMSTGRVERCVIRKFSGGNTSNGGGIYMSGGVVTRSVICECSTVGIGSGNGCGVCITGGRLDNSLVINNKPSTVSYGAYGGGVCMSGKDAVVANCVIADNACRYNGGLYRSANGGRVYNTIIIGNTLQYTDDTDGTVSDIGYALGAKETADEVFTSLCTPEAVGTGCVTGDPLFRDAANGDFTLKADSPCIRKGVWLDWMTVDFAGNRRVTRPGAKVDIGIYQSDRGLTVIVR